MIRALTFLLALAISAPALGQTMIAPNDPGFVYSPYNWNISATHAIAVNTGAYIRTLFGGSSLKILMNTANASSPPSQFWYRIDGVQGTWTKSDISVATTTATMPTNTAGYAFHLLEIITKSTDYVGSPNSWNAPPNTAWDFMGITIDAAKSVTAPGRKRYNVIFYGDSITQGVRTVFNTSSVDGNDAALTWSLEQGNYLNAEIGNIGWGCQGWIGNNCSTNNAPTFTNSWNMIYAGVSRTFAPAPDMIVINEGTNNNTPVAASDCISVVNAMFAAVPTVKIVLMRPFGGTAAAAIQSCSTGTSKPTQTYYMDTTGFMAASDGGDGVHPTGADNLGNIAPKVAAALTPILQSSTAALQVGASGLMVRAP